MDEQKGMGRREFFGKAAIAAAMVPAVLNSTSKEAGAQDKPPGGPGNKPGIRTKKIALEEHWANQELNDLRIEWGKRTGYPITVDPKGDWLFIPEDT